MTDNDLLQEIHRVREKLTRECDYDVHKIGQRMRQLEHEEMTRGVRYVSFAQPRSAKAESSVVREEPSAAQPGADVRLHDDP